MNEPTSLNLRPHALPNPGLEARGAALLANVLGSAERYFELERAGQAAFLPQVQRHPLLTVDQVWELVERRILDVSNNEFRMVKTDEKGFNSLKPERYVDASGRIVDPAKARQEYRAGASLAVQLLDRYSDSLIEFCTAVSAHVGHPVQASAYLTPERSQGLDIHHDTHDVLVVQLDGQKSFDVYPTVVERPLPGIHLDPQAAKRLTVSATHTLEAGDVLYLPRGVPHRALTGASRSLHVTIGILSVTWASLLTRLAQELYYVEPLNRNCPARTVYDPDALHASAQEAAEQLALWIMRFGGERLASLAAQRFVESFAVRPPAWGSENPVAVLDPDPTGGAYLVKPQSTTRLAPEQLRELRQHEARRYDLAHSA